MQSILVKGDVGGKGAFAGGKIPNMQIVYSHHSRNFKDRSLNVLWLDVQRSTFHQHCQWILDKVIGRIQDEDGKDECANRVDDGKVRAEDEDDGWNKYTNRRQKITQYVQTGGSQVDIRFLLEWNLEALVNMYYPSGTQRKKN